MPDARSVREESGGGTPAPREPIAEPLLWLGLVALLLLSFGDAVLRPNESVYLIGSLRNHDPSALRGDWSVGGDPRATVSLLYQWVSAPLWALSDDPLTVAMTGRLIVWVWVLAGFRSLARAFGIPAWAWAAGIALYVSTSRGLTAGEWIFGGAEQKVVCYGAVLFALAALSRGRTLRAGLWIGLATAFHIVVGGWSAIALGVAGLADLRRLRFGRLVAAGIAAGVIAAPILAIGVRYLATPPEGASAIPHDTTSSEILVSITNPHHCDPAHFLNFRTTLEIPLVFAAVLWLVFHTASPPNRRVLFTFVATICAVFVAGLAARVFEIWDFLILYPFRVADSLVPAVFWLCVPTTVQRALELRRSPDGRIDRATAAVLVIALLFFAVEVRHLVRNSYRTIVTWLPATRAERADELAIYDEIRARLPADAVVAAAPCESLEWLYGRRALVASYKSLPSNDRIHDWAMRMRALQGGRPLVPFTRPRCEEARHEFSALALSQLAALRDHFGATHALLDFPRDDLAAMEVARVGGRSVVTLDGIDPSSDRRGAVQEAVRGAVQEAVPEDARGDVRGDPRGTGEMNESGAAGPRPSTADGHAPTTHAPPRVTP